MENASLIGLSRQITLKRELDVVANNIANMNTTGFKLEELLVEAKPASPAYNDSIKRPANFAYDFSLGRDFSQGALQQTGNTLDFAVEGDGVFFAVNGPNGTAYTRDGAFSLNSDGVLVTKDGKTVQGDGGDIRIDPQKPAPLVAADGTISQGNERVGRISTLRISNLSDLSKQGDSTYVLKGRSAASPANDAKVDQGCLEASNVNSIKEITKLVQINRTYSDIAAMLSSQSELNRTAIDRLGRIA